ncbi:glycosyltransferase family 2 protein [Microbacterium sp. AGC85]
MPIKVSIIVPAYNVADYIDRCIVSLLDQSHSHIEILVVDDGSTDETYQLCAEHAARDSRIRLVHQQNSGVSVARNTGIELATGDWISFVDADDLMPQHAIEHMVAIASEFNADGVCGRYTNDDKFLSHDNLQSHPAAILNGREAQIALLYQRTIANAPFAKLFSKNAIDEARFPPGIPVAEDLAFNFRALNNMRVVVLTSVVVYQYLTRVDGAINSTEAGRRALALYVTSRILEEAREKNDATLVAAATSRHFMEAVFVGSRSQLSAQRQDCLAIMRENGRAVSQDHHAPRAYRALAMIARLNPSLALFVFTGYSAIKSRLSVGAR